MKIDDILLGIYWDGWKDQLAGKPSEEFRNPLKENAYNWGRIDCKLHDDQPQLEYQNDECILHKIKTEKYWKETKSIG